MMWCTRPLNATQWGQSLVSVAWCSVVLCGHPSSSCQLYISCLSPCAPNMRGGNLLIESECMPQCTALASVYCTRLSVLHSPQCTVLATEATV